jgi:hypothetical protein
MKMRSRVRGITLIGFVIVLCVVGFFAYMAMRLIPMYVEYFGVLKSMEHVRSEPSSAQKSVDQIRRDMILEFDTQYVDEKSVPPAAIQVVREAGGATLRVAYEKRVPFLYNLDIVGKFDKSVSLNGAGGE